jgi:hypothetical protein
MRLLIDHMDFGVPMMPIRHSKFTVPQSPSNRQRRNSLVHVMVDAAHYTALKSADGLLPLTLMATLAPIMMMGRI